MPTRFRARRRFHTGDKIRNIMIVNRQISDGVIGYWDKVTFDIVALLEAKVDGLAMENRPVKFDTRGTSSAETVYKRELAEDREVANRKEDLRRLWIGMNDRFVCVALIVPSPSSNTWDLLSVSLPAPIV